MSLKNCLLICSVVAVICSLVAAAPNDDRKKSNGSSSKNTDNNDANKVGGGEMCFDGSSPSHVPCKFIVDKMNGMLAELKQFVAKAKAAPVAMKDFQGLIDSALVERLSALAERLGTNGNMEGLCHSRNGLHRVYHELDKLYLQDFSRIEWWQKSFEAGSFDNIGKENVDEMLQVLEEMRSLRTKLNGLVPTVRMEILIGQSELAFMQLTEELNENKSTLKMQLEMQKSIPDIHSYFLLIYAVYRLYERLMPILGRRKKNYYLSKMEEAELVGSVMKLAESVVKPEFAKISGENTKALVDALEKEQVMPEAWFRNTAVTATGKSVRNFKAKVRLCAARLLLAYERVKKLYKLKYNAENIGEDREKALWENGLREVFAAANKEKKNGRRQQKGGAH